MRSWQASGAKPAAYRMTLAVPFAEKDQAKELGAKWDGESKSWYIEPDMDTGKFRRWLLPVPFDPPNRPPTEW